MAEQKTGPDSIRPYLTGAASDGGAQADPNLSLGKYRAASLVNMIGYSPSSIFSGYAVVVLFSGNNGAGTAYIDAPTTGSLRYKAPGSSSYGAAVNIANGETKMFPDGDDANKFVIVSRVSASDLSGTETMTLVLLLNNLPGFDNVDSAEAAAGDLEHRCFCLKNDSAGSVTVLKAWIGTLGTQRVSDVAQLGASGAGTIEISSGDFSDWPDSGFALIKTSGGTIREKVYYSSRTSTVLTVPATGREMGGTTAAAGAATDTVDAVPGIRIAKEAPSAQPAGYFTDKTGAGEGSAPGGVAWSNGIASSEGLNIGTLVAGYIYGVWIEREIPEAAENEPSVYNYIKWGYDSA